MAIASADGEEVLYLDANVFIYPVLYTGPKSDAASALLSHVGSGDEPGATCALTLDEVVWVVGKNAGREAALKTARLVLDLPNLRVLPVKESDVRRALDLMADHSKLSPRDALHASCAIGAGIFTIITDDADFDRVPGLSRRPLS